MIRRLHGSISKWRPEVDSGCAQSLRSSARGRRNNVTVPPRRGEFMSQRLPPTFEPASPLARATFHS
jgi:hypothetical protein